ncbi:MAG: PAS domain-containing protein [Haloarculaceae archaeon]
MASGDRGWFLEAVPDGVLAVDPEDGVIQACNDAACDILGRPRADVIETSLTALSSGTAPPSDGDRRADDRPPTVGESQSLWLVETPDGAVVTVETRRGTARRD